MRKLLCVLCIFVLFISLLGASNSGESTAVAEKAIPGESFGAGKGTSGISTEKGADAVEDSKISILPKLKGTSDPAASGADPEEDSSPSKMRALGDVVDSLDLPVTHINGSEWNGRYIYTVDAENGDSSIIRVLDPEDDCSLVEEWNLPFIGLVFSAAFVNNSMYVTCWDDGTIKKVNPTTHTLITSFAAPGGTDIRGITSDGEDLYVAAADVVDSVFRIDTLGTRLEAWYIGSFCDFVMDIAVDTRGGAMWLLDTDNDVLIHADSNGNVIDTVFLPGNPGSNIPEGISFDGSDLWFNTYYGDQIYRIDGGYSRSRIALFQDHEPWGHRSIKEILYDNGIPFKVFDSTDIGNADLSKYTKAIIPGQQDSLMGVAIADNKAWWENWISNGGVLQISGATYSSETWEGLTLPGDYSLVYHSGLGQNLLEIASSWHPIVNQPYVIDDDSLDGWNSSSHGWLTGLSDHYTVITDTLERPVLAIKRLGDGGIIATQMTLEYAWYSGYCTILENVIKYWLYGVSKNVLFALADGDQLWMRDALMARDSLVGNVDYMDARDTIAKVEDFLMYDVVLTYPNSSYFDEIAMGDTLAAFVDLGGRVITGGWCWYSDGNDLQGAIMDTSYNPFYSPSGDNHSSWASLGWNDAGHPMMDGVSTFSGYFRDSLQVNAGADTVAKYDDGEYLLGYRLHPSANAVVIGFNVVPTDTLGYWNGQGVKLLRNIINWGASYDAVIEDVIEVGDGITILGISSPIMTGNEWISLSIDSPTSVELRIINIAGMIASSKTLNYITPGVKRVDFDVSSLPSGPYFLSVKTQRGSAVRKALVIR